MSSEGPYARYASNSPYGQPYNSGSAGDAAAPYGAGAQAPGYGSGPAPGYAGGSSYSSNAGIPSQVCTLFLITIVSLSSRLIKIA